MAHRPPRMPRYPYQWNPPWPHERRGEVGEMVRDAVTGWWFPEVFAVDGPYGRVDGRNGNALDLDVPEHEASPDNIPVPPL